MEGHPFLFRDDEWVDPALRAFFDAPGTTQKIGELSARYGVSSEQSPRLFAAIRDIAVGKTSTDDFADALSGEVGVAEDAAVEMDGDFWAELFVDVGDALEKQNTVYQNLHAEELLPPPPPTKDPIATAAARALGKLSGTPTDPMLARRLDSLAQGYLKDLRDDGETKRMLEKPVKTGGMAFAPEAAAQALVFLAEEKKTLGASGQPGDDRQKAHQALVNDARSRRAATIAELNERFGKGATPTPPPAPAAPLATTKTDLEVENAAEKKEVSTIELKSLANPEAAEGTRITLLDAAVDEAATATGVQFPDEDRRRRFRMLLSLYFRDLRDQLETISKFTMPVASGGMGLSDADAAKAMQTISAKLAIYRSGPATRMAAAKKEYVAGEAIRHLSAAEEQAAVEHRDTERVFSAVLKKAGLAPQPTTSGVGQSSAAPKVIAVSMAAQTVAPQPAGAPVPAAAAKQPAPGAVPVVAIASAAAQKNEAPANLPVVPESSVVGQKTAATGVADASREPLSRTSISSPRSVVPEIASAAPVKVGMTDVQTAPKLTGPVQELGVLNLQDFRRLSKDPREATLKIKDKIDLLEELGFETKTQGTKAFLESPINRMYLGTLRASLEGRPVVDIIADLEAKGEPTLSKAEFDSLMDLNRRLRFG